MRIAIDTGGTFTDCIFIRRGRLQILKVPSTPRDPSQAIADALARLLPESREPLGELDLTCGTTVGTNALLERHGGRVGLVTTAGFEDVIAIGRQARPRLYDFFVEKAEPLVPRDRRFGLHERMDYAGRALMRPSRSDLARVVRQVARARPDAVAVCLLFSYANPAHERALARALRAAGLAVSVSHEILPEYREFERTATTVVNAYLVPVMSHYLADIERHARTAPGVRAKTGVQVRIMQSSGGIVRAAVASREPVRTILSGPAGGILGAQYVARRAGFDRVITFDMGGTSTDVALLEGALRTTNESQVADLPVAVPMLDIHTVGAGGGSLARFDRAGALRVGPESAGADPGPICYGRGERPTVTDAHLILGRIAAEGFLGGEFRLDEPRTGKWMAKSSGAMGSIERFAQGIVDVANAVMEKAIRVISVERGYDPRDYTLVAFGGAGGLHACDLASALEMQRVLIPRFPGGLSALGILRADVAKDLSQTVRLTVQTPASLASPLARSFARLEQQALREMAGEGFARSRVRIERWLDMRYSGQAYELLVPAGGDFVGAFHRAHERRYGYADRARQTEIVNVRIRAIGATPKPELPRERRSRTSVTTAVISHRRGIFGGRAWRAPVYDRAKLGAGHRFRGPAIITEYSATTVLPPGWLARVDNLGNLVLTPALNQRAGN
jgi:N-methylhydantoinase A